MSEPFKYAGTISHGTLRTQDLLSAFMPVLRDLNPTQAAAWSENERRYMNALDGTYDTDPNYTWADVAKLQEEAYDFLLDVQEALEAAAPEGYQFGTLEGDASDFGFWRKDACELCNGPVDQCDCGGEGSEPSTDDVDVLREIGMDEAADDLDREIGRNF